ncbi:LETM1-related biofilm-associated protein [Galbibacter mesophilus]|uniref:LETM1-related biofilm-associated protein n=1 Tax=Galbibacter mesophilus TaxID=379069 RepID=UPI00191CC2C8|nr:LETM1-related biofilm-associated protein [Galbibacter mesophilus]MCM5663700.1 LETM1-related biofilm-associated protein [Galbibacter mesophilus]
MNPSAQGWIDKFASLIKITELLCSNSEALHKELRKYGFIYGANVMIPKEISSPSLLSEDEMAKVNLLYAHYCIYLLNQQKKVSFSDFVDSLLEFYEELESEKISFFDTLLQGKKKTSRLEKVIHNRVYILENIFTKNFHKVLTNSLVYIDVIVYQKYLNGEKDIKSAAHLLEHILVNLAYHAITMKQEKSENDIQLLKLLNASLVYHAASEKEFDGNYRILLTKDFNLIEKMYFLDMVCLSAWEDHSLNYKESEFIFGTAIDLQLPKDYAQEAIQHVSIFFDKHKDEVSLFKNANPVKQFFDNSHALVKKLITRNSKRLKKELEGSKELVYLLGKSTTKELTVEERKKIREQLLDIFKTVPSLAIFALPGGAILLPIFIKMIPNLLPSAFDDNRVEEDIEE